MSTTVDPYAFLDTFKLDIGICDQRRGYLVEFTTEQAALDFIARLDQQDKDGGYSYGNHAVAEVSDFPIPRSFDRLLDLLYPTCEHGLSADLCAGPGHYPQDHPAYM